MSNFNLFKKKSSEQKLNNPYPDDFPLDCEPFEVHYQKMLSMDKSLDFYLLRMTFTETDAYDPYSSSLKDLKQLMYEAVSKRDLDKALECANLVLDKYCLDLDAHLICFQIYEVLKVVDKMEYFSFTSDGLFKSLLDYGNGKNYKNAIPVISVDEEYYLFYRLGIESKQQALSEYKGRYYDVVKCEFSKKNIIKDLYFDITIPYLVNSYRVLKSIVDRKNDI